MIKNYLRNRYIVLILSLIILFFGTKNTFYFENNPSFFLENTETKEEKEVTPDELYLSAYKTIKDNYWNKELVKEALPKWKKRYAGKLETDEDAKVAINSMLQSLDDPYSKFLDKKDCSELNNSINSKIYGIGINIDSNAGNTVIVNVIKGTPAYNAGIKAGDVILKINDEDTGGKNIFEVASLIKNSKTDVIKMEVSRDNKKIAKIVKKAEIKIKAVKSDIFNKEIGYIQISSFIGNDTPVEFIEAMDKVKNTKGLILDLRGNTGGLFQNALFVADIFLKDKNVVTILGRGENKNVYKSKNEGYVYENPMIVLVDCDSASASEIVSGALKDNKRALIVGTKTFGKGLVQKLFPLKNGSAINLTIARYLTPNNIDINKKGITPDYYVEITNDDIKQNKDRQLDFAIKTLSLQIERDKISKH